MEAWSSTKEYSLHDIVTYNGRTFYSLKNNNFEAPVYLGLSNLRDKPTAWADEDHFTWIPSYSTDARVDIETRMLEMGDGYKKEAPFGPSNDPIKLTYVFDNITDKEAEAIVNFVSQKGGEVFIVDLPFPYKRQLYFQASDITHSKSFQDVNSVSIALVETFYSQKINYVTKDALEVCNDCSFGYKLIKDNYLSKQYSDQIPNYSETLGYGDELFILQAWCFETNLQEDFLVKCKRAKVSGNDIINFDPEAYTDSDTLCKPLNAGGLVLDYLFLAKGTSTVKKPSTNSQIRRYYLDGEVQSIWVEAYGNFNTMSKLRRSTDAIVTPQLVPIPFQKSAGLAQTTSPVFNGQIINPELYGLYMNRLSLSLFYWTTKEISIDTRFNYKLGVLPEKVEKFNYEEMDFFGNYENGNILAPTQTLKVTKTVDEPNFLAGSSSITSRVEFGILYPQANNFYDKLKLSSIVRAGVMIEFFLARVQSTIIGDYAVPFGTNWNFYGPAAGVIGYAELDLSVYFRNYGDLFDNSYANTGLYSNKPSVPFVATSYLHTNSLGAMKSFISVDDFRMKTMPHWIGKLDGSSGSSRVTRCIDAFIRHYSPQFVNEAYNIYV